MVGGVAVFRPPPRPPRPPPAGGKRVACPTSPLLMRFGLGGRAVGWVTSVNNPSFLSPKVTSVNQQVTNVNYRCNHKATAQPPLSITGVELATAPPSTPQVPASALVSESHPRTMPRAPALPRVGGYAPPVSPPPPASAYASALRGGVPPRAPLRPLTRPLPPPRAGGVG